MRTRRRCEADGGASEVVGFILITGIAIASIAFVFLGGTPTLERIQSDQETDAMTNYMLELDHQIDSLATGSPASTTPTWRFSMARGTVSLHSTGHPWLYAVELGNEHLEYTGLEDSADTAFILRNEGEADGSIDYTASAWLHTADKTAELTVNPSGTFQIAQGSPVTITFGQSMDGAAIELALYDDATGDKLFHIYIVDTGAVTWSTPVGGGVHEVAYENSAIIRKEDGGTFIYNTPSLKAPVETGTNKEKLFFRVMKVNGTASVAGRTSGVMLLTGYGTFERLSTTDATGVVIQPPSRYVDAWKLRLTDPSYGYDWTGGGAVDWSDVGTNDPGDWRIHHQKGSLDELAVSIVDTYVELEVD